MGNLATDIDRVVDQLSVRRWYSVNVLNNGEFVTQSFTPEGAILKTLYWLGEPTNRWVSIDPIRAESTLFEDDVSAEELEPKNASYMDLYGDFGRPVVMRSIVLRLEPEPPIREVRDRSIALFDPREYFVGTEPKD